MSLSEGFPEGSSVESPVILPILAASHFDFKLSLLMKFLSRIKEKSFSPFKARHAVFYRMCGSF